MRGLEVTRSGLAATALVFVVAAVCLRLGVWQLDRRAERLERNAAVTERMAAAPIALHAAPADTAGLLHRRATVTGHYDAARTIVLAGRSRAGVPGVHVLAPLRLGDGAILVNRGWLPARDAATVDLEAVRVDTAVVLAGVLLPFADVTIDRDPGVFQATWFRLAGDAIRAQYPYPVAPLYLQAAPAPGAAPEAARAAATTPAGPGSAAPGLAPIPLDPPALDAGPHLSYAVQWFSFATIFLVGWLVLVMRGPRPARRSSPDPP